MTRVRLAELMWKHRINLNRLHEITKISKTTLIDIKYGRSKNIAWDTLTQLKRAFNCSYDELLEDSPDETPVEDKPNSHQEAEHH